MTKNKNVLPLQPTTSNERDREQDRFASFKNQFKHLYLWPTDQVKHMVSLFNSFATRKTISIGFFNVALVATNVAQIKQIAKPADGTPANWSPINIVILVFVCISLVLQFLVAIVLFLLAKAGEFIDDQARARLIRSNNLATILVLIISVINIFVNVFLNTNSSNISP